jgi:hypothetical protein
MASDLEELLRQNIDVNRQILDLYKGGFQSPYTTVDVDLTTAHNDMLISIAASAFIQVWCDGSNIEGISIKLGRQSNQPVYLNRYDIIPVYGVSEIYITNDVRSGRSKLTIYCLKTYPMGKVRGGESISREELAVRTGSISTFDRRGEILWCDDFECGINKWYFVGNTLTPSQLGSVSGSLSGKMDTVTASINDAVAIYRRLPYPNLSRYGFEIHFTIPQHSEFEICFDKYDGTNLTRAALKLSSEDSKLQYYVGGGVFQDIDTGLNIYTINTPQNGVFNVLKLVVDYLTGKYVRAILNFKEYDISSIPLVSAPNATGANLLIYIKLTTKEAVAKTAYIDDAIVTQNEP